MNALKWKVSLFIVFYSFLFFYYCFFHSLLNFIFLVPHTFVCINPPPPIYHSLVTPPPMNHSYVTCLEFQTTRFVNSTFTAIFFIISFVLLPPPPSSSSRVTRTDRPLESCVLWPISTTLKRWGGGGKTKEISMKNIDYTNQQWKGWPGEGGGIEKVSLWGVLSQTVYVFIVF